MIAASLTGLADSPSGPSSVPTDGRGVPPLAFASPLSPSTPLTPPVCATLTRRGAAAVTESLPESSLSRLMAGYQAGDAASFDALYAALAPGLRRYLSALTRDAARAEDLLQETFLRMHKVRHTYDPARPVEPWAFAIARHVFLMAHRRARRAREAPLLSTEYTQPGMTAPDVAAVSAHELARALDALPRDRREAVVLHHMWGFRFDEIAARLGIREGAARLRAHRGIKALRQLFKKDVS